MKVAVVGVLAESMLTFRGDLLQAMVDHGHDVLAMAPEDDPGVTSALRDMGVAYRPYPLRRAGINPIHDAMTAVALARAFRAFGPDVLLTYAAKPVVYGTLAAWLAGVPRRACMITGAGSALGPAGGGGRRTAVRAILHGLYALALRRAHVVIFQNPDDERLFRARRLLGIRTRVARVAGSGVDLARFAFHEIPHGRPVTFLMAARLLRDKGIAEYVAAARRVRAQLPGVRFQLMGGLDPNPSAISAEELREWTSSGDIEYLGTVRDVRPVIAGAHVCVLPSYGEGMPRFVLEGMAMGRPIITSDAPGCRETVVEGENGFLVPPRDAESLADAMLSLAAPGMDLAAMGRRSRELAEERFDVHAVNRSMLAALGLA